MLNCASNINHNQVCTINGEAFCTFMKNTCIGDTEASCHSTNDDNDMLNVKTITETVQGSLRVMKATKMGKKRKQVKQVNEVTERFSPCQLLC